MNLQLYGEVKSWKKPIHKSKMALARAYLKLLSNVEIIGIAGSVGKTLTQNAVHSVLSQKFPTVVGEENLDPTFRIPQTILKTKPWHKYMILEYGIEHPGEMDYYTQLVTPKYALLTIISPEHTRYFENIQGVLNEESKIIINLPKSAYALLNADDPYAHQISKLSKATVVWFGQRAKRGVKISHYKQNLHGASFRMHYGGEVAVVKWKVIGHHQLTSAYAAATLGILSGLTLKQIAKGLSGVKSPEHRLNLKITEHVNILDDTYNSSPKAALESIKTLVEVGKGKKKVAVLGEMRDLGGLSESAHTELGEQIAKTRINYLLTVGKIAGLISISAKKAGFKGKILNVKNTKETLVNLKSYISPKAVFLIKGSRHEHLERIVLGLTHKSTAIECYHCGKLK
ncbi:MAG: Mur ligase family protein [Patescibacteria group bacterium]